MSNEREQYIESEFRKWEENFIIPFEQEFSIRTMLELQFQYKNTPDDHVRSKRDLIETIQRILNNLRLKPRISKDQFKVLVISNNPTSLQNIYLMFRKMFQNQEITDMISRSPNGRPKLRFSTKDFVIDFVATQKVELIIGKRADYILNLTGNREIDEYFRNQNRL